jgi:hypothetical protein
MHERRPVPIFDITIAAGSEGFTTEWVLTCSRCGKPADLGDHAACGHAAYGDVVIDVPEDALSPSCP